MDFFKLSDDAFMEIAFQPEKRRDALGKARLNRLMTLGAAVVLFIIFMAMFFNRAPTAEIFGGLAVVNFALFLKSDSDVKVLLTVEKLFGEAVQKPGEKSVN